MKVSVVTPSFNQARFLRRTLESVAAQAPVALEHVVFDAASTDGSVAILRDFRPAVRWHSGPDRGQAHAVNKGIAATDGEVVAWLNSDDVYYPGALARVVAAFEAHPEVDVVYGMADHIDEADRAFEAYPTEPWNPGRLEERCFICQPAAFFRRRAVEAHGALDESLRYCMDYEYWLRLGRAGARFLYLPEKLAGSRLYGENKTLGERLPVHAEINDMLRRRLGRVPDRWLVNYGYARADLQGGAWPRPLAAFAYAVHAAWHWNRELPRVGRWLALRAESRATARVEASH